MDPMGRPVYSATTLPA